MARKNLGRKNNGLSHYFTICDNFVQNIKRHEQTNMHQNQTRDNKRSVNISQRIPLEK